MVRYIIRRILMIIPIILGVTLIVFFLLYTLPGSSIKYMEIDRGGDALDAIYRFFGAGSNFFTRYIRYCFNIFFHFDFSRSVNFRRNVMHELAYRGRNTLLLLLSGVGLTLVVGIPVGAYAAVHKDSKRDRAINIVTLFLSTIPNYAVAILLTLILVLYLRLLPLINSYTTPRAFILPALTISIGGIASIVRMTRTSMLEVLEKPYITALRSKGLGESSVIYRHALKNALIPVISVLGGLISQLLFGTLVVEFFFTVPALGSMMLNSVSVRDHFTILGCTVMLTVILVATNIVADILYALVDPQIRLRYAGSKVTEIVASGAKIAKGELGKAGGEAK